MGKDETTLSSGRRHRPNQKKTIDDTFNKHHHAEIICDFVSCG